MNEKLIITKMIDFVEERERQFQLNKMYVDQQAKNDVVKSIMDELERVITNENTQN